MVWRNSQRFHEIELFMVSLSLMENLEMNTWLTSPRCAQKHINESLNAAKKAERVKCSSLWKSFVSFPPEAVNLEVALCV